MYIVNIFNCRRHSVLNTCTREQSQVSWSSWWSCRACAIDAWTISSSRDILPFAPPVAKTFAKSVYELLPNGLALHRPVDLSWKSCIPNNRGVIFELPSLSSNRAIVMNSKALRHVQRLSIVHMWQNAKELLIRQWLFRILASLFAFGPFGLRYYIDTSRNTRTQTLDQSTALLIQNSSNLSFLLILQWWKSTRWPVALDHQNIVFVLQPQVPAQHLSRSICIAPVMWSRQSHFWWTFWQDEVPPFLPRQTN